MMSLWVIQLVIITWPLFFRSVIIMSARSDGRFQRTTRRVPARAAEDVERSFQALAGEAEWADEPEHARAERAMDLVYGDRGKKGRSLQIRQGFRCAQPPAASVAAAGASEGCLLEAVLGQPGAIAADRDDRPSGGYLGP